MSRTRRDVLKSMVVLLGAAGTARFTRVAVAADKGKTDLPDLVALVNPLQGTNSNFGYSRGNTLPLVARPWGMTYWTPQTGDSDGWFFDPNAHKLQGIRATREPSPWIGDYGKITIMGQVGDPVFAPEARAIAYDPKDLQIAPNRLSVLLQNGIRMETTPTDRCSVFRFTFPAGQVARVLIDVHEKGDVTIDSANRTVSGRSRHKSGGAPDNFACYFIAVFDTPFTDTKENGSSVAAGFGNKASVTMRIATSFISFEQAQRNLDREVGTRDFDAVVTEGAQVWNQTLGRVLVTGGTNEQRRTFYSCLYRSHLFPRMFHEFDAAGQATHYSPYDGKVHPGVMYTDTGLWDGYHTVYPLMALLQPERLGEMVEGFVNAYREGGWLPQWPSPGTRGGMGGTHSDAVIADAILKNVPGISRDDAYAAMWKNATVPPGFSFEGRHHLEEYLAKGYVFGSVSNSLDIAYDDACISMVAQAMGKTEDATLLKGRAQNYRLLFDPQVGFMRSRDKDGNWQPNFDPYAWGDPYTEGSAWQWSWSVPHDPAGLISLMGGREPFLKKLDRALLQPSLFHVGSYGQTIHEMKEMAAVPFGQYDQGNQPGHSTLFMFTAAGCPWKTQYWTRRVLDKLYTPDNFPGDEDNGEMAAWYVFNALGFYPMCTGHPSYVLGSPLFRDVRISLTNGKTLRLSAPNNSAENVYVRRVVRDGVEQKSLSFAHADLAKGGQITFEMGAFPHKQVIAAQDLPFSMSPYTDASMASDAFPTEIAISCGDDTSDCFFEGGESAAGERRGDFLYRIPLPRQPEDRPYRVELSFKPGNGKQDIFINGKRRMAGADAAQQTFAGIRPDQGRAILIHIAPSAGSPNNGGRIAGIKITSAV